MPLFHVPERVDVVVMLPWYTLSVPGRREGVTPIHLPTMITANVT